jgi:hypothetical protein
MHSGAFLLLMLPTIVYKRFRVPLSMFDKISGYTADDTYAIYIDNETLFTEIKLHLVEGTE